MASILEITENKRTVLESRLRVDLSMNRYDLTCGDGYELYDVDGTVVPVMFEEGVLRPGLYLTDLGTENLRAFSIRLFETHPAARAIRFLNIGTAIAGFEECRAWRIDLPGPDGNGVPQPRPRPDRDLRRRRRLIANRFESVRFDCCEDPAEMDAALRFFLDVKSATHGFRWSAGPSDYRRRKAITHVFRLFLDDRIAAVNLISRTNRTCWFFESTAYDHRFAEYAPGACLFDYVLETVARSGCRTFHLGVGTGQYKRRFGAVAVPTYNGWIFRDVGQGIRTEKALAFFGGLAAPAFLKKKFARLYGCAMLDRFHRKILTQAIHGPTASQRGVV